MTRFDLLVDPAHTVYAVNCRVEGSTLHCGALYLEPGIPFQVIRLSHDGASLDVELPLEVRDRPTPTKAWEIPLNIVSDGQIREPSVLS